MKEPVPGGRECSKITTVDWCINSIVTVAVTLSPSDFMVCVIDERILSFIALDYLS